MGRYVMTITFHQISIDARVRENCIVKKKKVNIIYELQLVYVLHSKEHILFCKTIPIIKPSKTYFKMTNMYIIYLPKNIHILQPACRIVNTLMKNSKNVDFELYIFFNRKNVDLYDALVCFVVSIKLDE